jgi:hypothetical protein
MEFIRGDLAEDLLRARATTSSSVCVEFEDALHLGDRFRVLMRAVVGRYDEL